MIGSRNSSNSNRLVEAARAGGVAGHLIDDETEIDESWLDGVEVVGVTSGASAPEKLVERVCDWFRARGVTEIEPYRLVDEASSFGCRPSCAASSRSPTRRPESDRRSRTRFTSSHLDRNSGT